MLVGIFSVVFFLIWQWNNLEKKPLNLKNKPFFLRLTLNGPLNEDLAEKNLFASTIQSFYRPSSIINIYQYDQALAQAAKEPLIKGLFLDIDRLSGSFSNIEELRTSLERFKKSGKMIYGWIASADTKSYYLASICDRIFLTPTGQIYIPGPLIQNTYFGDALKKLGVSIEIVRAGSYKSAVEPFIVNQPSEAASEMNQSLSESLSKTLVAGIKQARGEKAHPIDWFKKGLLHASEALDLGLVDELSYLFQAQDRAEKDFHAKELKFDAFLQHLEQQDESNSQTDGIAIIEASGDIQMDSDDDQETGIGPRQLFKELDWAEKDNRVKAILLKIKSPGGSALASDLIAERLTRLKQKKPIVAYLSSVAASGGYYIAAPADKIITTATTLTGSIGVFGMIPKFQSFAEKYGISFFVFSQSDRRNLFNPGSPSSTEDLSVLEKLTLKTYDEFKKIVARGRNLDDTQVEALAGGRVWTGEQALNKGLVDRIGTLHDALEEAKILAKLPIEDKVPLLFWQKPFFKFSECFRSPSRCLFPPSEESAVIINIELFLKSTLRYVNNLRLDPVQAVSPEFIFVQ